MEKVTYLQQSARDSRVVGITAPARVWKARWCARQRARDRRVVSVTAPTRVWKAR